jgi:hypothetical protein
MYYNGTIFGGKALCTDKPYTKNVSRLTIRHWTGEEETRGGHLLFAKKKKHQNPKHMASFQARNHISRTRSEPEAAKKQETESFSNCSLLSDLTTRGQKITEAIASTEHDDEQHCR